MTTGKIRVNLRISISPETDMFRAQASKSSSQPLQQQQVQRSSSQPPSANRLQQQQQQQVQQQQQQQQSAILFPGIRSTPQNNQSSFNATPSGSVYGDRSGILPPSYGKGNDYNPQFSGTNMHSQSLLGVNGAHNNSGQSLFSKSLASGGSQAAPTVPLLPIPIQQFNTTGHHVIQSFNDLPPAAGGLMSMSSVLSGRLLFIILPFFERKNSH